MTRSWRSQIADEVRASSRMTPKWPDDAMKRIAEVVAERDAALAEVARLSTPPDDAEVADLVAELGEPLVIIEGYSTDYVDTDDVRERMGKAADALTRLSHALAAETAKREAMEAELRYYADQFCEGFCTDMPCMEYTDADCERDCGGCKARATLAKHGSKT